MKKKILAIIMAMVMFTFCFAGCDLFTTDAEKDMSQTVAIVDISQSEDFEKDGVYEKYEEVIQPINISKRELVTYFVSVGYNYVTQGMEYEEIFDNLLNSLVDYKIIVQYAMIYFFEEYPSDYSIAGYQSYVGNATGDELLNKTLLYFLSDELETFDEMGNSVTYARYEKAEYELKKAINESIDTQEEKFIRLAQNTTSDEEESLTLPDNANTANEDYYDPDYDVYTGSNLLTACGSYEKMRGSTATTRRQAYNAFLNNLAENDLITEEEIKTATSTQAGEGIQETSYYESELLTQMQASFSEKLEDTFEKKAASGISAEYLRKRYEERMNAQKEIYSKDSASFESDLSSISDSSFVLYAPAGRTGDETNYGFVYNIVLPFSAQQSYQMEMYKSNTGLTPIEFSEKRAELLSVLQAKDQRSAWFNGAYDYSFDGTEKGVAYYDNGKNSKYLFFEDSMTKSTGENAIYQKIDKYYGHYPYNGSVTHDPEYNEYELVPNKLSITEFLTEMESYLNYALEQEGHSNRAAAVDGSIAYNNNTFSLNNGFVDSYGNYSMKQDGTLDYSKFLYYVGKVSNLTTPLNDLLIDNGNNPAYTALSAFNELQFAYSSDTGCFNTYLGYSINRGATDYVGEFEYAAKLAVAQGAGTYTVCPSDFGWHIIYCTYAFEDGEVYGIIDWEQFVTAGLIDEDKLTKDSFEYYFYESIKASLLSAYQNKLKNQTVNNYNNDTCVTIYENRYSDYSSMENTYQEPATETGTESAK